MHKTTETINLFYRNTDILQTDDLQSTFLYSSSLFNVIAGAAFYNVTLFQIFNTLVQGVNNYDMQDATFFLNDEGTIFFKLAAFNKSEFNMFKPGELKALILGGSGKYLYATGTVTIIIDENLVRNITIEITY